jgi:Mg/Co/Ni transporter MgtE
VTAEERVARAFMAEHPEDAALVLELAEPRTAADLPATLEPEVAAEVYRMLGPTPAAASAAAMPNEVLAAIIDELPLDIAALAMRRIATDRRDAVIACLRQERQEPMRRMMSYPEHTAGALADPLVQAIPEGITAAEAQDRLRGSPLHLFSDLYVVARDGRLVGAVPMADLMSAPPSISIADLMTRDVLRLDAFTDIATVAAHPAWREADTMPVVDLGGRLVGGIRHIAIRQLAVVPGRPMMSTLVGLSELYWTGLTRILTSFEPARGETSPTSPTEVSDAK